MQANALTMQADALTMQADALTMQADTLTMQADTLTMQADALTLSGIAKFNSLRINEMLYLVHGGGLRENQQFLTQIGG
ncbi:MAG: hypothetical protein HWQ35_27950 [Nostoc sp. NMS1]|nr:hypothetical protein [Nostoc sp. NMS1]MBN3993550.1 hypothetical protein [Nostoc sp. NMS2]